MYLIYIFLCCLLILCTSYGWMFLIQVWFLWMNFVRSTRCLSRHVMAAMAGLFESPVRFFVCGMSFVLFLVVAGAFFASRLYFLCCFSVISWFLSVVNPASLVRKMAGLHGSGRGCRLFVYRDLLPGLPLSRLLGGGWLVYVASCAGLWHLPLDGVSRGIVLWSCTSTSYAPGFSRRFLKASGMVPGDGLLIAVWFVGWTLSLLLGADVLRDLAACLPVVRFSLDVGINPKAVMGLVLFRIDMTLYWGRIYCPR